MEKIIGEAGLVQIIRNSVGFIRLKMSAEQVREMLWGGRWEGGSCLGPHVRIKDFKI